MMGGRGRTGSAIGTAAKKSFGLEASVANILVNPRSEWISYAHNGVRTAAKDIDWQKFNKDDYLLTQCTIVCSVETEDDGHTIIPACNNLVNANGNAWTNDILLATFRSFVGAQNYLEHCQIPALSKGTILDAVIRPVEHTGENGEKAHIYYVDILVATSREHKDLVEKIESGRLTTLSMGATCEYVTCSKCGGVFTDDDSCEHIKNEIGQKYYDEQGKERIVSELCGRMVEKDGKLVADPNSVTFIEASWVEHPAFKGAVLEQYIEGVPASTQSKKASYMELTDAMEDIFKLRVADEKSGLILKVAQDEARRLERENRIARLTNEISC